MQRAHLDVTRTTVARSLIPFLVFGLCMMILSDGLTGELWRGVPDFFGSIGWQVWIAGFACTGISFFALGQYDVLAHRHMGSDVSEKHACLSGMTAIAVGQTIGFGVLSGAVCRWRALPNLGFGAALALSAFVAMSFIAALAVLTALTCLVLPTPRWTTLPALGVILFLPFFVFALFRWPRMTVGKADIRLPSLRVSLGVFQWTVVDTFAAAAALWLFLPQGVDVSLLHFFPVYLIALGAGVLFNTPGGLGPFELVLLGFFPDVGAETLLQSIIAFRLVYYVVPACLGAVALLRPLEVGQRVARQEVEIDVLKNAPRAEVGVIRQNGGRIVDFQDGSAAFWSTPQTVTALFSPVSGPMSATVPALQNEARRQGKIPVIYKCTAREAVAVRKQGWPVVHVADDALLCPTTFCLDVPSRRSLRRKLRAAKKAGVTVCKEERLPLHEMRAIDAEWRAVRGPARGGTLGRFCERYVSDQWMAVARVNGVPVAFISLFTSRQEWCLDLLRHGRNAPNGTMHALILCALEAARAEGVTTLSLAAIPPRSAPQNAVLRYIHGWALRYAGSSGLTRFKSSFAPQWAPRYAASQNRSGLALGLADIAREVHKTS